MKDQTVRKKKKAPVILAVMCAVIGFIAGFVIGNASRNMKVMKRTLDDGMKTLSSYADVRPVDAGEYEQIKMYGLMKFDVSQYDIENTGNLSVMTVNMGFMQMVSFVITPYEKNMPMLSMDFMYILGNRKAYAEFYDLVKDTSSPEYTSVIEKIKEFESRYASLENIETEPAWYDKYLTVVLHKAGDRSNDNEIESMFSDAIHCYMEEANKLEQLSDSEKAEKLEIIQSYCDDLVSQGGVSTDVFKKVLGEEKTKDFFDKVFFGTERYK